MSINLLRQRILQEADRFILEKRLDRIDQIFDLTLDDLFLAIKDPSLDLRLLTSSRKIFINKLKLSHNVPAVIDSRGKIIRPKSPPAKEGELAGQAISVGIIRGKVKVLLFPDEKPLLPGEILVTRATDPGWTPLFVNAGAVVLEVGGMLQHGALVAREYGKPCVAGIENATTLLKDNMLVEVDGTAGIIRIIENHKSESPLNSEN